MLKGRDQLTKRQYVYATTNDTTAATFNTTATAATLTATSIAATCKVKIIKMKITKVYKYTDYQNEISVVSATANCIKLKLLGFDENDVQITKSH